jgi:hypothetical protein
MQLNKKSVKRCYRTLLLNSYLIHHGETLDDQRISVTIVSSKVIAVLYLVQSRPVEYRGIHLIKIKENKF